MPNIPIPEYQQRTNAPGPIGMPRMQMPDRSGVTAVASALGSAYENYDKVLERDGAIEATDQSSKLAMRNQDRLTEMKSNAKDDAAGFMPQVMKAFDDDVNDTISKTKNPYAKNALKQWATRAAPSLHQQALEFEVNTRHAYRNDVIDKAAQRGAATVQQDPDSWRQVGEDQILAIEAMQLPPQERLRARNYVLETTKNAAAAGYAQKYPLTTLNRLQDSNDEFFGSLSVQAREAAKTHAETQLVRTQASGIVQTYADAGQDAGKRALSALSKSDLSPDLQDQIRAHVNAGVAQLRDQRRQEHVDDLTNLETAIATDTASTKTLSAVQSLYRAGALTPSENAHYTAQIESSIVSRNANQAALQSLTEALNGGLPLTPADPTHQKILSQAFAAEVGTAPAGSQQWTTTAVGLAQRTRMLPKQAASWASAAIRSPKSEIAGAAAQFLGAIQASAPDAMSSFDNDTKAFAGAVNSMIEGGTDMKSAVETVRNNMREGNPAVIEQREKIYKQGGVNSPAARNDAALKSFIGQDFDAGWFHSNPVPLVEVSADFATQTAEYFKKTGDITLARQLAWSDLKRVVGVSEVNGIKQLMAFPVERAGVKPEEVRKDIATILARYPQHDGSTANDIVLVPDGLTLRLVSDLMNGQSVQPSYALKTKTGANVVDDQNVRQRYTLPGGEALAAKFRAAQAEAAAHSQNILDAATRTRQLQQYFDEASGPTPTQSGLPDYLLK